MRNRIGKYFAACFSYSGLVRLAHCWTMRSKQSLIILNYHRASEGDLRSHLHYLCRQFRLLPLVRTLEELYTAYKEEL